MKKTFLLITLVLFFAGNLRAAETFLLKDASRDFYVTLTIESCAEDICEGRATIVLQNKRKMQQFQTIEMENMYLELGADQKPTANLVELYGENNSGIIFDDFNFDGREDLAVRNGNNGAYGGPSYDIFLQAEKFEKNAELTALASENLGLFTVDKEKKQLETFNKSGCCWHQTVRYEVVNNKPKKVYVFTEDATGPSGKVKLTTETLVRGKWKKTEKSVDIDEYYKDN